MADLNNIEWPSFDSVFRELSPERVEAREVRLGLVAEPAEVAEPPEVTEPAVAIAEEPPIRDIPESTVDDIAAVVMSEISGTVVDEPVEEFVGQDQLSDDAIDQLMGNEEFMGYLVDLDSPAPDDFTVSPEEAASANFIATPDAPAEPAHVEPPVDSAPVEPEIEYAPELGVEIVETEPTPEPAVDPEPEPEPRSMVSLFNNAETTLYTESDPEWVWAQFAQQPPPPPPAPSADPVDDAEAPAIDLVEIEQVEEVETAQAPDIDLVEAEEFAPVTSDQPPAPTEDPWAHMRPTDDDTNDKKIVFWADRPKFFGGQARHDARAARRLHNKDD